MFSPQLKMIFESTWNDFNIGIALLIFVAYFVVDALYAHYTLSVTKRKPFAAATTGSFMHFILAFGVLSYVQNFLYVIPLAIGSWIGTYIVVEKERRKSIKLKLY